MRKFSCHFVESYLILGTESFDNSKWYFLRKLFYSSKVKVSKKWWKWITEKLLYNEFVDGEFLIYPKPKKLMSIMIITKEQIFVHFHISLFLDVYFAYLDIECIFSAYFYYIHSFFPCFFLIFLNIFSNFSFW